MEEILEFPDLRVVCFERGDLNLMNSLDRLQLSNRLKSIGGFRLKCFLECHRDDRAGAWALTFLHFRLLPGLHRAIQLVRSCIDASSKPISIHAV